MTRRYHRYLTIEQASQALKVDISQVLGMLNSGELRGPGNRTDKAQLVNSTDIELARQRLENLRRLDGDVQQ
ncbi:hypothetical protein [Pseudarthrobacter sp. NamE5]|uniref:hypothetical protein n=1 Tax=Pseudarthrobacter sp. NamE5 TaxID=2576839 RepID=UPI00110B2775|nr:hypothetical protein [Pseudarthrobacter sp. NamE5]TLM83149.1 hypothetical protein FDW84_14045 [Pseudarthrobacter sp. NamE5]